MIKVIYQTVILYLFLLIAMRIMGKRELGQLEVHEFITTFLLSEIAAIPLAEEDLPITNSLIPMGVILILEILISFVTSKFRLFKKIVDGVPTLLMARGKVIYPNLKKSKISIDELISELRTAGTADITTVAYAILEPSGKISVIPKAEAPDPGIAHTLISDSEFNRSEMKTLGISEETVKSLLKAQKIPLKDVLLFTQDDAGNRKIILKSGKIKSM